MVLLSPGYK